MAPHLSGPALPRRERAFILTGLVGVAALAWGYMLVGVADMEGMATGIEGMTGMAAARLAAWSPLDWILMFLMWAIMMVGMMLPSATPTILLFAAVRRKQNAKGHDIAPVAAFVVGYLVAWTGFSIVATIFQWGLERLARISQTHLGDLSSGANEQGRWRRLGELEMAWTGVGRV